MFFASFPLLGADMLEQIRMDLENASWEDGKGSAGYLSQAVKQNCQLPPHEPFAMECGNKILAALNASASIVSFALPLRYEPPQFNRYQNGQRYGRHIDGAIRPLNNSNHNIRTDLSATVFLSDPDSYAGGELCLEDGLENRQVKLPAGSVCIYSAQHVHQVMPVTKGQRLAAFFWIQSMVRSDSQRTILFNLDQTIQRMAGENPNDNNVVELANIYHNLLREWAET